MEVKPSSPGWKGPLLLLGGFVAIGLTLGGLHFGLDAALQRHRAEVVAFENAFPVDASPRPAVLGPAEPGNVWELLLPAFVGLEDLDPDSRRELARSMSPAFNSHGAPADTPELIGKALPWLEQCRRAARRSDLSWTGPIQPELPVRAGRAMRALCSKGLLLWMEGRDAEAVEWLLTALTVAYDTTRLTGEWRLVEIGELWVRMEFNSLLEEQSLTAAQLEDLGRKLALLRSVRPSFVHRLRQRSLKVQQSILETDIYVPDDPTSGGTESGFLSERVGWREAYSLRLAKARILKSLRSCGRELESLSWDPGTTPSVEAARIESLYTSRFVQPLLPFQSLVQMQEAELIRMDLLAIAVDCARYQALQGRLPRNAEESGVTHPLIQKVVFTEARISCWQGKFSGFPDGVSGLFDWAIARRR